MRRPIGRRRRRDAGLRAWQAKTTRRVPEALVIGDVPA